MAPSFFRKLVSRTKAKRSKVFDLRTIWIRPSLEALDERILPSVSATLNNGILSILADTTGGTTQVEIIHNQDQVTVEDTQQLVNNFGIDQIQQIQFQYTTQAQQQYNLNLPVGQNEISLTGLPVGEADLNLGDSSLTASINAKLPDGTDISLAGMVDSQGNYDVSGHADVTVAGFALQNAGFEVTNTSVAVAAAVAVGQDSVSLSGTLDNQGNYDLMGNADVTVDGFALPATSFELTNTSLAAAATLAIGGDNANLSGTVDSSGNYDLTATLDSMTIGGFTLTNASVELTNTSLAAGATVALGSDSVTLNGTMDSSGNYDLTGTADITIAGFALPSTGFELTNAPANGIKVATMLPLGDDTINLSGTVDADANYDLMATSDSITIGGFTLTNASVELTNTSLTVGATLTLGSDSVTLNGSLDSSGNYDLTGTADITIAGFALPSTSFELTNAPANGIHVSATLPLGSDTVSLSGTVDSDGNYDLMGTADITVGGFALSGASFELTNTSLTVSATLALGNDSISLSGTVDNQGNYDLTGTADITVGSFALPGASFELTNTSLTVSATLTFGNDSVSLAGTVDDQGNYDLTGTADITVGGFALPGASFELTNTSLTVSATLTFGNDSVSLAGTVDSDGNYDLTGTADITVGGFALPSASFELTNTSLTVSATLTAGDNSVSLSGTVDDQGNYDLTGTADITVGGFALPGASFELTNTSLTVSATLTLGSDSIDLSGTVGSDGNYDLTGTANITVATIPLNANFELTNTSLTVSSSVTILGSTVNLSGTVDSDGNYDLTGTSTITVAGFSLNASFELTNTSLTVSSTLDLGSIGSVNLSGTYANGQLGNLTGTATITVDGFNLNANFTLSNTSLTVATTLALGSVATVNLTGTVLNNQGHYSLSDLSGTAMITVDGFNLNANFTLTSTSITVGTTLALGSVATVNLTGTVNKNGSNYSLSDLTGTAAITVDGFNLNANFTLTSTSITVGATLALGSVATVNLTGTVNKNGSSYSLSDLSGTAAITVDGFNLNANFTLTNTSITVATTLALGSVATVNLTGTVNKNGSSYSLSTLTGTAAITVDGFNLNANFTLTSTSITVGATLALGSVATVNLTGTVNKNGSSYSLSDLTGTATITVDGFNLNANFTLTNTSITVTATLALGSVATVSLTGTVNKNGSNYSLSNLTGTAAITVDGFNLNANFTLTNTSITVATTLALGSVATVNLAGTVNKNGSNYSLSDLTGTAAITVDGFNLNGSFTLTSTSITVTATLALGSVATVSLTGTVNKNGSNYSLSTLTGTAAITVDGFNLTGNFTLTNTNITVGATLALGSVATVSLTGTVNKNGSNYSLSNLAGTAAITVDGFNLNANFTLTSTSITVGATLALGSVATVNLTGTVNKNGNNYSLSNLAGTAAIMVDGFNLTGNFTLTSTSITVGATLALGSVATVNLTGTVNKNGSSYSLSNLTGTATITVDGFNLNGSFTLTSSSVTVTATLALGSVATVSLTGTVNKNGSNYSLSNLTGTATITVGGFNLTGNFTLTNTSITVTAGLAITGVGTVSLTGTVNKNGSNYSLGSLTGTANVTIAGFNLTPSFTLTSTSLTVAVGVNIPSIGTINFSGTVDNHGNFSLTGTANVIIAGFNLSPTFTLTNTSLTVGVGVNIPSVGTINFSGTVDKTGNFSLMATAHIVIAGFALDAGFKLTNTSLTVSATLNLPIVGNVTVSGTVDKNGNYSLTAAVSDIHILFVTLTSASVTLTNSSLIVAAHASNLPLIGNVDFKGTITGSSYTFTATIPSVSLLGFTLKNISATLTNNSLSVGTHVDSVPLVGSVDFTGTISSGSFSLAATAHNVTLLGFIHFNSIALTLDSHSLSMSATVSLPIVNTVTFTGAINFNGSFTISATAPHFTVLGFIGIDNAQVSISFPNPKLTVSAHINLLNIGMVDFTGSIGAGGTFSFDGSASLTVAGFTLGTAKMHMGNMPGDPSDGIHIGPFTTPALPLVGPVTIEGSYASGGRFSFRTTIHPNPPIFIGPIPVDAITFGLSNDSLTLGIGVGYNLAGILNLTGYGQVTVFAASAQHNWGDFDLLASVDVSILGFSAANGQMELKNTKGQFSFTVDMNLNLIIARANMHGEIDFNKGLVGFTGRATIGVAGFTLSNSTFLITNAQVQGDDVNGWTFKHDAQGHLISGGGIHIEVHSHTNLNLQPVISANVDFDGTFAKNGSGYKIDVKGKANLTIAGFNLASATLEIDNTHMAVTVHYAYPGIFSADFAGTVTFNGNFDMSATATIGLAGFGATGHLHLYKMGSNAGLDISAHINVIVAQVDFSGYLHSNGQFQLTGTATAGFAGFGATASFTLNNGGVSVSAHINVFVAQVDFTGYVRSNGQFSLTGSANVGLAGFSVARASFTLNNGGVSFSVHLNVIVAQVDFTGYVHSNGQWQLTGRAGVGFAGFGGSGSFTLNNSGLTFAGSVNVIVATINVSGYVYSNGSFRFDVNTRLGFAGFGANGHVTLSNGGVSVSATLDLSVLGIRMNFSGAVYSNGSFSFHVHTGLNWGVISASADLYLSNHGFSVQLHAGFDLSAGVSFGAWSLRVGFRGSVDVGFGVNTNGTFNASGNVQACAYVGIGLCVGIGFHVNNHQFCFNTHDIGFSIWGVGFHPFGDLCIGY